MRHHNSLRKKIVNFTSKTSNLFLPNLSIILELQFCSDNLGNKGSELLMIDLSYPNWILITK